MKAEIIKIGNSKGLRIPKAILKQCRLKNIVNLTIQNHTLLITPFEEVRLGWEEHFKLMAKNGDDILLIEENKQDSSWDEEEWTW